MSSEQPLKFPQARDHFLKALELQGVQRAAYLAEACGADAALRARVEELLRNHRDDTFLESPADGLEETVLSPAMPLTEAPGTVIGRYKLLQQIGEGGMGVVYMAEQVEPVRRRVALKIIKVGMDTKTVVARFEAERQALAMMDHPNIAKVLDAGATDTGRPYFVMELVRGVPITEYSDRNHLPARARLELFIPVCQAIQHAHQKGIIHRDIKPSNVLVSLHDGQAVPVVIDFGIAKATNQQLTEKTYFTNFSQMIGTPAYMSPEQAEMSRLDVDTRSDVYSLGVLLYELLTGTTPFPTKELLDAGYAGMQRILAEKEPPRPSTRMNTMQQAQRTTVAQNRRAEAAGLVRMFQGDLDWIVMKCLEKDRGRRYETVNGLAADILRHLKNELVSARPPSIAYRLGKAARRNRIAVAAVGIVVAGLILGLGLATAAWRQARAERNKAVAARSEAEEARIAETAQRRHAEAAKAREAELRVLAQTQELAARRRAYAADMNRAQQELHANNLRRARDLLARYTPGMGEIDLRGWEWRYLWQLARGDALFKLCELPGRAGYIGCMSDGKRVLIGQRHGSSGIWDIPSRTHDAHLEETFGTPKKPWTGKTLRLSDDGEWLASLSWMSTNWTIKVTELHSGRVKAKFDFDKDVLINSVALSPDKSLLAVYSIERGVYVWKLASTNRPVVLPVATPNHFTAYGVVAFSPDGKLLGIGDADGRVRIVDASTFQETGSFQASAENGIIALAFSPDGRALAAGCVFTDPRITVWDPHANKRLATLEGHRGFVSSLAFSPDGRKLASASGDQVIKLWNTSTWKEETTLKGHVDEVWSVTFSRDGKSLVSGSKDRSVLVWPVEAPRALHSVVELPPDWEGAEVSPDGSTVAAVLVDGAVVLWNSATGQRRGTTAHFGTNNVAVFFSDNGELIIGAKDPATIKVYDPRSDRLVEYSPGWKSQPAVFWYSPRDRVVFGASEHSDGLLNPLQRWDMVSRKELPPMGGGRVFDGLTRRSEIRFSLDDSLIAAGTRRSIAVRDTVTNQEVFFHDTRVEMPFQGVSFIPGKKLIAMATTEAPVVYVLDLVTGREIAALHGHNALVQSTTASRDGSRLVTATIGSDPVRIWDTASWEEVLSLEVSGARLSAARFLADGSTLIAEDSEWRLHFWRAPSWAEIEAAEKSEGLVK